MKEQSFETLKAKLIKTYRKYGDKAILYVSVLDICKEVLKQAIPEILEEVANKAKIQKYYSYSGKQENIEYYETDYCSLKVNKELITSLSESLIQKYTK